MTCEGEIIIKTKKSGGWRERLCGWKVASRSRGEIYHKPGRRFLERRRRRMRGKVPKGGDEERRRRRRQEGVSQGLVIVGKGEGGERKSGSVRGRWFVRMCL